MDAEVPVNPGATTLHIIIALQFGYPMVLLIALLAFSMLHSILDSSRSSSAEKSNSRGSANGKLLTHSRYASTDYAGLRDETGSPARQLASMWFTIGVAATFVADAAVISVHALLDREKGWWCGQGGVVYVVGAFVIYVLVVLSLIESKPSPNWAHGVTWSISLLMEAILLGLSVSLYTRGLRDGFYNGSETISKTQLGQWEIAVTSIKSIRALLLMILVFSWVGLTWQDSKSKESKHFPVDDVEERTGLLDEHVSGHINGKAYGSTPGSGSRAKDDVRQPKDGWVRPEKMPERGWYEYVKSYSLFFPYLWPSRSRRLQLTVLLCLILVAMARVTNVLVPKQSGKIVNQLAGKDGQPGRIPWESIAFYIVLRIFQGSNGLLGALRSVLWIPVSQHSFRKLATASFEHVHGLSLDFHLNKKTGEVVSALNKGGSINGFLETITFSLLPMMIDMVVAVFVFLDSYDAYYALTLFVMIVLYMFVTIRMTQTRVHQRREMANLDREEMAVKSDSLMSYETVKYFNAEQREFSRYRDAVKAYQRAEYKVFFSLQALNVSQMGIFMGGLLITCLVAAYQVARGDRPVGAFVELITYMSQLQAPLNYFGTFYRSIQSSMINAERLLELFKQKPTVNDKPDAQELTHCKGEIECKDVRFSYDSRHPALEGVTFRCTPGTSTALVGESGGGKSTMFRLLFRFYNLDSGAIKIDGHNIEDVTVDSLRRYIGVVPQDTILFNETIMYNLRYANPDASDEQVYNACRAACIHDKILAFPDGYSSKVGERGLKLSGGEKQRIAIARTILKNPRIILLDEATAALDTDTEDHIQEAFNNLQSHRTTLIIAHRLSTITKCDQILVLNGGRIVETGTHLELIERGGRYANLWKKQMKANKFNMEISRLTNKAKRLENNTNGDDSPSASQSEDERGSSSSPPNCCTNEDDKRQIVATLRTHKKQGSNLATSAKSVDDTEL